MANSWIPQLQKPPDGFDSFLELYNAWEAGKTADPVRLKAKLGKLWADLSKAQRQAYTDQLVALGKLQSIHPLIIEILSTFGGHIHKWEVLKWKRTL